MSWEKDIRVVVGIDFGTTFTGFGYCHIKSNDIVINERWPGGDIQYKTNTVLQYDNEFKNVIKWGNPALAKRNSRRTDEGTKPIELFKLNLGDLDEKLKPKLPLNYKRVITDYLRELGKLIKKALESHWEDVSFYKNVLLVLTVPAEYSEKENAIMRDCAHEAELISDRNTELLQFTTEPEAAAIYCMENCLKEHDLTAVGTTFMIVDCGGGTVDLTTRKIVGEKKVGEITERTGDYCGSTFVDRAFLDYLGRTLGFDAIDKLRKNHYKQLQYMVQEFCRKAKFIFTGEENFSYELDIPDVARDLIQYVTGDAKELMEEKEWLIEIKYDDIKPMFDPTVKRILNLIEFQLKNCSEKYSDDKNKCSDECSIMFLVGGFSQSIYLQKEIRSKFKNKVKHISVPTNPVASVVRGAALYGLSFYDMINNLDDENVRCILTTRVLKFTYGIKIHETWKKSDPIDRKTPKGDIVKFQRIAKRGDKIEIDKEFTVENLGPCHAHQTVATFYVYYTREYEAKYIDEEGMHLLGTLKINLSDVHLGYNRALKFGLSFGKMEIKATARNVTSGQSYVTTFEIEREDTESD